MNKDNKPTVSYDGSIFTTLQLIFLVLKLTGLIDWSWWLVFTPFFASIVIAIIITIILIYLTRD